MIAKILKSTNGFSGVLYSELKINEGKASFCAAVNFPFDEINTSPDLYVKYFDRLVETSERKIKNRQFHAVISTKGKVHDKEFMTDIGKKWMQKMGYGEQPYLIYFHGDTDNNHIHIVSCRINKEGKRINPYMEGRRAGIAIKELMNENLSEKAKADIADVMNNYNFSTTAQFRLVLERRGWKTVEKDDNIKIINTIVQGTVATADVKEKSKLYKPDEQRKKQLFAIISKYKGLTTQQLQNYMRTNFGVDIIFHTARAHTQPYGFTVIDHKNKQVFKGSEIIHLEALLNPVGRDEHTEIASEIINAVIADENYKYSDLNKVLRRNGYNMKKNEVYIRGDEMPLLRLENDLYKRLRYNDRKEQANRFIVRNREEAIALAKIFFVKAADIKVKPDTVRDDTALRDAVSFLSHNRDALNDWLNERQMVLVSHTNNTYIIDTKNSMIADVSGLKIEAFDIDRYNNYYSGSYDVPESIISMLAGLFAAIVNGIGGEEQDDIGLSNKKKKRKMLL
jgi:virulence-associated protein VapD